MLDLVLAPPGTIWASGEYPVRLSLHEGPLYAFFAPYFSRAQLSGDPAIFLSLCGSCELSGDQIERLRQEIEEARLDLLARPPQFRVLRGWRGVEKKIEEEIWGEVDRAEAREMAEELIRLCDEARSRGLSIIGIGD